MRLCFYYFAWYGSYRFGRLFGLGFAGALRGFLVCLVSMVFCCFSFSVLFGCFVSGLCWVLALPEVSFDCLSFQFRLLLCF